MTSEPLDYSDPEGDREALAALALALMMLGICAFGGLLMWVFG